MFGDCIGIFANGLSLVCRVVVYTYTGGKQDGTKDNQ